MNEEHREQYLMHYGVLGMKWGVRRRRTGSKVSRSSGKKVKSASVVRENQNGQTKRRMSNNELQARVKRLRLESEYARLVRETTPVTVSRIDKAIQAANTISKMSKTAVDLYENLNTAYNVAQKAGLIKKKSKV